MARFAAFANDASVRPQITDPLADGGVYVVVFAANKTDVIAARVEDEVVQDSRVPVAACIENEERLIGVNGKFSEHWNLTSKILLRSSFGIITGCVWADYGNKGGSG